MPPEEEKFIQHKTDGTKRPQFTDVSMTERDQQRVTAPFVLSPVIQCIFHNDGHLSFSCACYVIVTC